MKYGETKLIGFLANFIQSFWRYEIFSIEFEHAIIPDGYLGLIVEFENSSLKQIKLTGVRTIPINVVILKLTKLPDVRFKLLAAEYILQREIKSILNINIILRDTFWNISGYQTNDFEIFVSEISNYLGNLIKHFKEIDSRKLKFFESAYQRQNLPVEKLLKSVFWSSRQINRCFNRIFGFSLKLFLNIVRRNALYKDISRGIFYPSENYFDQAHFIREIKKYTEKTPRGLSKDENVRFSQLATKRNG